MTNRFKYVGVWAEGGFSTDPDLDTKQPAFVPDKYEKIGWTAEKPPEEWQNFTSQITDLKIKDIIIAGIPNWEAGLSYQQNALVYEEVSGEIFLNISGGITTAPLSDTKAWGSSVGGSSDKFLKEVANMRARLQAHVDADNPHQDTVDTLVDGSYIKDDVNLMFSDKTDARTLAYHMAQIGAVHRETPEQVGTLPNSGGTFTGDVSFHRAVMLPNNGFIHYNTNVGVVEIVTQSKFAIGTDSAGNAYLRKEDKYYRLLSEENYNTFEITANRLFVVPTAYNQMTFNDSLSDTDSIGDWTVLTSKVPQFDMNRGLYVVDNPTTLIDFSSKADSTLVVIGAINDKLVTLHAKVGAKAFNTISGVLEAVSGVGVTHVRRISIYSGTLSKYQIGNLENGPTS